MEFFNQAIDILKILVMALGAGLAVWGVINLLEGYGSDKRDYEKLWGEVSKVLRELSELVAK